MKKLLTIFALLSYAITSGQSNVNADCINAIPLCNVPTFTFFATSGVGTYTDIPSGSNISNPTTNPASSNSGCLLSGELNPQWLMITVGNAGSLEFIFGAGNGGNPQVGFYDWAMWKYTPSTCNDIFNNTLAPVRCNWNGSSTGGTGIASASNQPTGSSASNFEPPLTVNACDQFIICISNYSGVNTLVGFQNIGTASLSCDPNCLSVTNASLCSGGTASIIAANSGTLTNLSYSMNPGGFVSNTPTFVVSPPVTGNYTVYATGLNIANVPVTQTAIATVTVYNTPSVTPTFTNTTCTNTFNAYNLNLTFVPSATPAPSYTVSWLTPGGSSTSTITADSSGGLFPGPYSATITSTGGCQAIANFTLDSKPDPAPIVLQPAGPVYSITCLQPTVTVMAMQPSYNYTWTNQLIADKTGSLVEFNYTGVSTWTVTAENPVSGCINTKTIVVGQNTVTPVSTITPMYQNITCTVLAVQTITAMATPSVNVTHFIESPLGGTFSSPSYSTIYVPGYPGTYTHVALNNINGCKSVKTFTVASNDTYPRFDLLSSPPNFTLGCGTKSVITVNMLNGQLPPGGPVTFTMLSPSASSVLPGGLLSTVNSYTNINVPGTWTAVVRANQSGCETRQQFSVLSNTFGPSMDSLVVERNILTCYNSTVTLKGISFTPNIKYTWTFKGGSQAGDTLSVFANYSAPTATVVDNYSLTIEDNNSTCKTFTVVPILQNIVPPVASIGSTGSLTCKTTTLELTNQSKTSIRPGTFPSGDIVQGAVWQGPSPQEPGYQRSTYVAHIAGMYSLTAKDLNNGCTSSTTTIVGENKIYPVLNDPDAPPTPSLGCGAENVTITPVITTPSTNLSFSWTAVPGATVSGNQTAILKANLPGIYRLLVTDKGNGCSGTTNMEIGTGTLLASFEPDRLEGFAPMTVNFINRSTTSSAESSSITSVWSLGNGTTAVVNSTAAIATIYTQPGTYTVTLFVKRGTCIDSVHQVIKVESPSGIVVPNVFTPNGDGVNDLFFLQQAVNLVEIKADISDRWGHKVYTIISETGQIGWDGKNMAGVDVAEGVYFYIIHATGSDGQKFETKGTVTLIR